MTPMNQANQRRMKREIIMLNSSTLETDEARFNTTYLVEQYLRRHGASLCDLLDALEDPSGFAALCDLHTAYGQPIPDVEVVESALRNIHRVLAEQLPSSLDRIGHERRLSAADMTRWHGARVSELLARCRDVA
ncbi:hypothetical protein [Sulfitobacter sp. TMED3]|uniref:hypothetical protein n=1 Tax=Sulfitobacter sp. TMED3 TaxID=1986591 RepID=UPI00257E8A1C|nr:hypothetical protein [Sulfitobacter sp. TMED3]